MRRFSSIVLLLMVVLFSTCAFAAEPVKIGVSLGLTGKHSEASRLQEKSFRLWETDVNRKGGMLGKKVKLIIYDNRSEASAAKEQYEYLIKQDHVDLLFSPYSSEHTEAILPLTEEYGYPIIASGASADELWEKGYKYFFGLYTVASRYAVGFLELLVQDDFKDVAIIYAGDPFSRGIAGGTKQWAEKFGLRVLLYSGIKDGKKDFDDIIVKARDSKAEVLIVCGYFNEAIDARLSMKRVGWHPKVYYASVGPAIQAYYEKLGQDANHAFSSSQWEQHGRLPGSKLYHSEFVVAYGEEPSYHAANAYAAGQILESAVRKAGSLDRKKIRNVLSAMNTVTIIGRYGVDKTGRQVKHFPLIIQWQDGKRQIVWPKDLSTATPIFK